MIFARQIKFAFRFRVKWLLTTSSFQALNLKLNQSLPSQPTTSMLHWQAATPILVLVVSIYRILSSLVFFDDSDTVKFRYLGCSINDNSSHLLIADLPENANRDEFVQCFGDDP